MKKNLAYKVLHGVAACNGGSFNYEKYLPVGNKAGKWLPIIKGICICSTGYHLTMEPHKWSGNRVFLCEYKDKNVDGDSNKIVVQTFRFLKEITISNCIDIEIYVRIADLSGSDLRGAYLRRAYLRGADLSGQNLDDLKARGAIL